jgi:hypothetical protein
MITAPNFKKAWPEKGNSLQLNAFTGGYGGGSGQGQGSGHGNVYRFGCGFGYGKGSGSGLGCYGFGVGYGHGFAHRTVLLNPLYLERMGVE